MKSMEIADGIFQISHEMNRKRKIWNFRDKLKFNFQVLSQFFGFISRLVRQQKQQQKEVETTMTAYGRKFDKFVKDFRSKNSWNSSRTSFGARMGKVLFRFVIAMMRSCLACEECLNGKEMKREMGKIFYLGSLSLFPSSCCHFSFSENFSLSARRCGSKRSFLPLVSHLKTSARNPLMMTFMLSFLRRPCHTHSRSLSSSSHRIRFPRIWCGNSRERNW